MAHRPSSLVYWTGKDITLDAARLSDDERRVYVQRLFSILNPAHGLWMKIPDGNHGRPGERLDGQGTSFFEYEVPMTCFTELRLTAAADHATRYGLLGVGVKRDWVLKNHGGPVHYVQSNEYDLVVRNAWEVDKVLEAHHKDARIWHAMNIGFMKRMGEPGKGDFIYLEELEWRIIKYDDQWVAAQDCRKDKVPHFELPLPADAVHTIVFPDARTRDMAVVDDFFKKWVQGRGTLPTLIALEDCADY